MSAKFPNYRRAGESDSDERRDTRGFTNGILRGIIAKQIIYALFLSLSSDYRRKYLNLRSLSFNT